MVSIMDWKLEIAARAGDEEFLKRAVASKIPHDVDYFLGLEEYWRGNIFNLAGYWGNEEFLKEALRILPTDLVHQLLSSQQHRYGWNPLHDAVQGGETESVKLMLGFYKSYTGPLPDNNKPWLALSNSMSECDSIKWTPLHTAIMQDGEDCALEIMSMDMELFCGSSMLDKDGNSLLFLAVEKGFNRVAEKILNSGCSYSLSGKDGSNAFHVVAPHRCSDNVVKLLLKKHLDCLNVNVLRKWLREKAFGPLEFLLDEKNFSKDDRSKVFGDLIGMEIVQKLVDYYQRPTEIENGNTPLHMAIYSGLEQHALYFLSLDSTLREKSNNNGESPLLVAIDKGCEQVVKEILRNLPNLCCKMLLCRNDGVTLLHLLKSCSEETGKKVLGKFWWMINLQDNKGRTALDEVKNQNVPWLENLLTHTSSIQKEHFDWIKACEKDETWAVKAFIDTCDDLKEVCRKKNDTPLHHIKFATYKEYQNFLKISSIKELKNTTDGQGATPLHIALRRKDINLAKALLVDTELERINKLDNTGTNALGLLVELCKEYDDWDKMCKQIKVNPFLLQTTYIQPTTNLDQMRNTLSVVAALLATITFTAAFTLPGGVNSNGYATLAKKPAFMVFLLADAYAMCTSMLALFCLIWSMIYGRDMSYSLVDRSMLLLMQSLYGTMLAFMTGIYVVTAHETLWIAIVVLILCSSFGILVNNRAVLHMILYKLNPFKLFRASKKKNNDHIV